MREEDKQNATQWVRHHTQPCPGCGSRIEKNGGCNHMSCSVCRRQFCWVRPTLPQPCCVVDVAIQGCNQLLLHSTKCSCMHASSAAQVHARLMQVTWLLHGFAIKIPVSWYRYHGTIICCLSCCRSVEVTGQSTAQTLEAISGAT